MTAHYFDPANSDGGPQSSVRCTIWGVERQFRTSGSVFSKDGLDHATAILMDHFEPPTAGMRVLDLGCGWGPIACSLARPGVEVWAVDVNPLALQLTASNAADHGLEVHTCLPEDVSADLTFDQIWSNPPIRVGKAALHELLATWLSRLAPAGEARMVVGKNLGADSLQRWISEQGWPTERVASSKGFRVLRTTGA